MNKAGLRKVTKTVRGKKGAVKRSYWVKAQEAKPISTAGFLHKHAGRFVEAFGGGAVGGAIHKHRRKKGDSDGATVGGMTGASIGVFSRQAGKRGAQYRADFRRMSKSGKAIVTVGLGTATIAGHIFGYEAHERFSSYRKSRRERPPIRVRDVNKGNGYV